jgi:imidazole glycerol-phosphate synthase subunit HisF
VIRKRIIPILLLHKQGIYKTTNFEAPKYIGDPINIIRIFNEKQVDEIMLLDIDAARQRREPEYALLEEIVSECFCPLAYGGAIASVDMVRRLTNLGIEKAILNTASQTVPGLIEDISTQFGRSTVVGSIDYKAKFWGKNEVMVRGGTIKTGLDPVAWAIELEKRGAGEICLNCIDREGTMKGYDLATLKQVVEAVGVPVIAAGGAGSLDDLRKAILDAGAAAAAAGSLFVYHGKHRAVLVTYPEDEKRIGY